KGVQFLDNLCEHNSDRGIASEIEFDTVIRGNTCRYNGTGFDTWAWCAQILVQNARPATVQHNTMVVGAGGGDRLAVVEQDRGDSSVYGEEWRSLDYRLRDNLLIFEGSRGQTGVVSEMGTNTELWESGECTGLTIQAPQSWWDGNNFEAAGRFNLADF